MAHPARRRAAAAKAISSITTTNTTIRRNAAISGDIAIERLCSAAQRADLIPYGGAPADRRPGAPAGWCTAARWTAKYRKSARPAQHAAANSRSAAHRRRATACPVSYARRHQCMRQLPGANIQVNGTCCSVTQLAATAACSNSSCPAGQTPIGPSNFCCNSGQVYSGARRRAGLLQRAAGQRQVLRRRHRTSETRVAPRAMCRSAPPVASPAR